MTFQPALPHATLSDRFTAALDQVQEKLVHLLASAPLLLLALLQAAGSDWALARAIRCAERAD